jgi:hypothetical protein
LTLCRLSLPGDWLGGRWRPFVLHDAEMSLFQLLGRRVLSIKLNQAIRRLPCESAFDIYWEIISTYIGECDVSMGFDRHCKPKSQLHLHVRSEAMSLGGSLTDMKPLCIVVF